MYLTPSCDCDPLLDVDPACPVHGREAWARMQLDATPDSVIDAYMESKKQQTHLEEMAEQDRIWKERRMVSGHGAQDGSARDPNYKSLIVFLGGPIKHWWDENWMTPPHLRYDEWRGKVEEACIAAGFLVYKPFTAWKGTWNEQAQAVNNAVIQVVDIFLDLTPPGVPSVGTDEEREVAQVVGTKVVPFPPPEKPQEDAEVLASMMADLTAEADKKNV